MRRIIILVAVVPVFLLILLGMPSVVTTWQKADASSKAQSAPEPNIVCHAQATPIFRPDISTPLRLITPVADDVLQGASESNNPVSTSNRLNKASSMPSSSPGERPIDPAIRSSPNSSPMPTAMLSIPGISNSGPNPNPHPDEIPPPPDMNIDVGLNHVVQVVNGALAIWEKGGTLRYGPYRLSVLWRDFSNGSGCGGIGTDPIVLYDSTADRWLISHLTSSDQKTECVAVSTSSDPLGSYYRYAFQPTTTETGYKPLDYPKFGVWPNGYYMSSNNGGNNHSAGAVVLQRDAMLVGRPARYQACEILVSNAGDNSLLPADLDIASLDRDGLPPEGRLITFASLGDVHTPNTAYSTLYLYTFSPNWNNPGATSFSSSGNVTTVAFYPELCGNQVPNFYNCVPQLQPSYPLLSTLGDRLMHRLVYRTGLVNGQREERLLGNHTVDLGGKDYRSGIRWFELLNPNGSQTISQQATHAYSDTAWRWMGSIAMDRARNIALGYSKAGPDDSPSVMYSGREPGDPAGFLREEAYVAAGDGAQTHSDGRWGDYSMMAVDPVDDCTFWYTNEYYQAVSEDDWRTRIGKFKFASCQPYTCPVQFTDVTTSTPFREFILCLACKGIVSGYANNTFGPVANVTRAQLCKIISNSAFLADNPLTGTQTFQDVPPSHPFYVWIERMANSNLARGFLTGYPCGSPEPCVPPGNKPYFRPNSFTTRGQISQIVSRAANFNDAAGTQIFQDVPPTNVFYLPIQRLARREIITGYECGSPGEPCVPPGNRPYFRPYNNVTRGQMTRFAAKTFFPNSNCGTITTDHTDPTNPQSQPDPKLPEPPGPVSTIPAPVPSTEPTLEPTNTPANTPTNTPTPCPGCGNFADVQPGTEFYPYVSCLNCNNVIGGYECGSLPEEPCDACNTPYYRPDTLMVRGQLAKIVSNAAGYAETPSGQQYQDVPSSNPYYQWVYRITVHGVIGGYQCGGLNEPCGQNNLAYFRPYTNATRSQVAKAVSNASGYNETPTTQTFEDIAPGSTFYLWVERLATRNIMNGYPCGGVGEPCISGRPYFRPYSEATRGQASKATSRSFFPSCNPGLKPGKPNAVLSATVPPQTTATQAAPSATISAPVPTNTALQIPSPWPTAPLPIPTRYVPTIPPVGTAAPPTVPVGTSIPTVTIPIP